MHDHSGEYRKQESITGEARVYGGAGILWWAILAVVGSRGLPVRVPKQDMSFFAFAPTVGYRKPYNLWSYTVVKTAFGDIKAAKATDVNRDAISYPRYREVSSWPRSLVDLRH